jgi:hypothetical protein
MRIVEYYYIKKKNQIGLDKAAINILLLVFFLRKMQITTVLFSLKIEIEKLIWGKFVTPSKLK